MFILISMCIWCGERECYSNVFPQFHADNYKSNCAWIQRYFLIFFVPTFLIPVYWGLDTTHMLGSAFFLQMLHHLHEKSFQYYRNCCKTALLALALLLVLTFSVLHPWYSPICILFGPMWKGVISPSKKSLTRLKLVRPMLQEPSTRKIMSAAAPLSHSSDFLGDVPKQNVTNLGKMYLLWKLTWLTIDITSLGYSPVFEMVCMGVCVCYKVWCTVLPGHTWLWAVRLGTCVNMT